MKALTAHRRSARRGPTIYEVARRAGVSIATVSRVHRNADLVAPATLERVRRAVAELDYRPNRLGRSLAHGRHDATGVVFPDLSGPYYSAVIHGFEDASAADGQSVLILATHRRNASAAVLDLADRVDGLVLFGRTVDDSVVGALGRRGLPVVLLARPAYGTADTVRSENRSTARALVDHLLGVHGYQRIAFLGDPHGSPDAADRWQGFIDAHRAAGMGSWRAAIPCAFREAEGRAAAATLLADPDRPQAIVCANDEIALGVLAAARALRIAVPTDLAVTGWDDIPAARHLATPLTTVRQPMLELGRRAAELLRDRITTHRRDPLHELLPTELVVRSSCGCSDQPEGDKG